MSPASDGSPDTPDPASDPASDPRPAAHPGPAVGPDWLPEELDIEQPPRISAGKVVTGALSVLLVAAVLAWILPWATGAQWPQIIDTLLQAPAWALPAVALLGAGALALEGLTVRTAVTGSHYSSALLGHTASTGVGLALPGGSVVGLALMGWILRRAGPAVPVIITGIIAASLVEMVITSVLIPLLGLASYAAGSLLAPTGIALPGAIWAALLAVLGAMIALALTTVLLRRAVLTSILDRLGDMIPSHLTPMVLTQRDALVAILRRRTVPLVLPTFAARVLQWAALLVAINAVGADVPLLLTVAIFALGRVLSLVPVTPGGAGITETVGAAALVALGVGAADAAAAMLLLLITTLVVPLAAGAMAVTVSFVRAPARRRRA
ncbi:lysylphosphatidylglycerol synthase domain-containing protein [Brachybacterium sp. FME24]|uniref:lysylphosphatidylglycerol synthase domain-containing protein n=1 Tax=Brachybacterium sp. FME24 TaxID=2742605 RepID=UPI001867FBF6|nr:lysylphosphatidylglycerol synthase domain-containing protein [Brachybacterium sp. FME24]